MHHCQQVKGCIRRRYGVKYSTLAFLQRFEHHGLAGEVHPVGKPRGLGYCIVRYKFRIGREAGQSSHLRRKRRLVALDGDSHVDTTMEAVDNAHQPVNGEAFQMRGADT